MGRNIFTHYFSKNISFIGITQEKYFNYGEHTGLKSGDPYLQTQGGAGLSFCAPALLEQDKHFKRDKGNTYQGLMSRVNILHEIKGVQLCIFITI